MKRQAMLDRIIALRPCYEDTELERLFEGADSDLNELDVINGAIKAGVPADDVVWLGCRLLPRPHILRFAALCVERARGYAAYAARTAARASASAYAAYAAYAADAADAYGVERAHQLQDLVSLAEEETS